MTNGERWKEYFRKSDEKFRRGMVETAKEIERIMLRIYRGDSEKTSEVLDARAERERIWGK